MLRLAFSQSTWHYEIFNLITLGCLLSGPTLWESSGLILSRVVGFFGGSPMWVEVCFTSSRRSFKHHVNTFPFMCESRDKHLVINLSYHTCILFIFNPFFYSTMLPCWLATSYGCPYFTVLMWSYHWRSRYPFALVPLWEWIYNSPWCISGYYHNYCFGKWSPCSQGLPPFPLPHSMTRGNPYH